jgi:hypothetical protein
MFLLVASLIQLVQMLDGNFTNLVGNLPYGSNTIVFSAGFRATAYTEFWKIWIDYNQNGVFESSEEIVSGSSSSSANLTSTFLQYQHQH